MSRLQLFPVVILTYTRSDFFSPTTAMRLNKDTLNTVFTGVLCLCALVITGMAARREFEKPSTSAQKSTSISNWKEFAHGDALLSGPGPVTMVVFSDYKCPYCRALSAQIDSLGSDSSLVSIYYRNIPIPAHTHARAAAFAAECAGRVGAFARAHRLLFKDVDSIGVRSWGRFAAAAAISDTSAFAACVRDSLPVSIVQADERDAQRLQISATPTFLVDNELIRGTVSLAELRALLRRHAASHSASGE